MNIIKRTIVLLLAVVLSFTLVSCGNSANNDNNENNAADTQGNQPEGNMDYKEIYNKKASEYAANVHPIGVIVMEDGSAIVIELYEDIAENTVRNFISLANQGFYDGIIFHRVIANFMIQAGDPLGKGTGGPGYKIPGEFLSNGYNNTLLHTPGVISMARQVNQYNPKAAYNTAGSQFFICVNTLPSLDGDYATFGKVIDGMDIVYAISKTETDNKDRPKTEQKMAYVRVDTHGVDYPAPETIPDK